MNKFVNRKEELVSLQRSFDQDRASLYVLYGRRRLGKTTLLRQFASQAPSVYHMADRGTEREAMRLMAQSMAEGLKEPTLGTVSFDDWYGLFAAYDRFRPEQRSCLILDEYQYLTEIQPAFSSIIQRWWDEHWSQQNVMLILCGSVLSMMYKETLSRESPLFGRRDGQWLLEPLRFCHMSAFFPDLSPRQRIELWALTGGVPRYLELARTSTGFDDALSRLVLSKDGPLYAEARFLLQDEVTVANVYWSLLHVIGSGAARISEIAGRLGMAANQLTRYLAALQDLGYVRREVPVTEKNPQRSKRGLYQITDPFLRLWFGVISRYESLVEFGRGSDALRLMRPALAAHTAWCFEGICRQYVENNSSRLGIVRVGRYWDRQHEIDVVGVDAEDKVIWAGECKMTKGKVGVSVLAELRDKVEKLPIHRDGSVQLAIFSAGGFTHELACQAKRAKVLLVDAEALDEG